MSFRITEVRHDQSVHYHPFARQISEAEWLVEVPGSTRPIGTVRADIVGTTGELRFWAYGWDGDAPASEPFEGAHPTLFHAVSWLRWRCDGA